MAKKRGNNEGSIVQRKDGRWMASISVGTDPATGKPKRKSFYGKTRKEAAEKMREALNRKDKGMLIDSSNVTVKDWLNTWLNDYKKQELKISTFASYQDLIENHITPGLGAVKLDKLRTNGIQKFYNNLLKRGRADLLQRQINKLPEGKKKIGLKRRLKELKQLGLSPRTVKYIHSVLSQALDQAVKEGYIYINPATATTRPRQVKKEITPLTTGEVKLFLDAIQDEFLYPVLVADLGTGLRRGELLGLKWEVVDLEAGTAYIKRQLIQVKGKVLLEEYTKTKGSTRTISLPAMVVRELKKLKKQQEEYSNAGSDKVISLKARKEQNDNYVFCWPDGKYIRPDYAYKELRRLLEVHGLPNIRFHDLRHTFATMLLEAGEHPKIVSEMLGHSSITITLDLYSHVLPSMKEKAAAKLNEMLDPDHGQEKEKESK